MMALQNIRISFALIILKIFSLHLFLFYSIHWNCHSFLQLPLLSVSCRLSILIFVCLRVYVSLHFCVLIQENVIENWTVPILRYYVISPAASHKNTTRKTGWKSRTIWSDFSRENSQRISVVYTIIFTQSHSLCTSISTTSVKLWIFYS